MREKVFKVDDNAVRLENRGWLVRRDFEKIIVVRPSSLSMGLVCVCSTKTGMSNKSCEAHNPAPFSM